MKNTIISLSALLAASTLFAAVESIVWEYDPLGAFGVLPGVDDYTTSNTPTASFSQSAYQFRANSATASGFAAGNVQGESGSAQSTSIAIDNVTSATNDHLRFSFTNTSVDDFTLIDLSLSFDYTDRVDIDLVWDSSNDGTGTIYEDSTTGDNNASEFPGNPGEFIRDDDTTIGGIVLSTGESITFTMTFSYDEASTADFANWSWVTPGELVDNTNDYFIVTGSYPDAPPAIPEPSLFLSGIAALGLGYTVSRRRR